MKPLCLYVEPQQWEPQVRQVMAPVTPWAPTLWHCKASSVTAAAALTGCAPTPGMLPVLLCSRAMWWAQPGNGAATILERRKATQNKEVRARGNRGKLSTSAGNSNCPVSLLLPPLWFSVCFLCVLKEPRVSCLPLKGALCFCSTRSSQWAWSSSGVQGILMVDGAVSCSLESLWIAFSCPNFPD